MKIYNQSGQCCLNIEEDAIYLDLSSKNLSAAIFNHRTLPTVNFSGANLRYASFFKTEFKNVDFTNADVTGVDFCFENWDNINLRVANLTEIKKDFYKVLSCALPEIEYLRNALVNGKIDGWDYSGECACLIGTIANARSVNFNDMSDLTPDYIRPIEQWFLAIKEGDTPENNQVASITLEWIDEFLNIVQNPMYLNIKDVRYC